MAEIDVVIPDGLFVARGVMDPEFCDGLAAESRDLYEHMQRVAFNIRGQVTTKFDDALVFYPKFGPRTKTLVDGLNIVEGGLITVNKQEPHAVQTGHIDGRPGIVLYPEGEGEYRYEHDNVSKAIPVLAGDVVINALPELAHQGRNTGNVERFTMSLLFKNA